MRFESKTANFDCLAKYWNICVKEHVSLNHTKFINSETGKLINPLAVVTLKEFHDMLNPEYKTILKDLDLQSNIKIVFYDSLPNPQFIWAIEKSQDFVGCTGDDSFSRVVSMGKIPMYFSPKHKIAFKRAFDLFLENEVLWNFMRFILNLSLIKASYHDTLSPLVEFQITLTEVNYSQLEQEIFTFRTEIIEKIKQDFSIFDNICSVLNRNGFTLSTDEYKAQLQPVEREPREFIAFKYFDRFRTTHQLKDLVEIVKLYFTARLFPEDVDYLAEVDVVAHYKIIAKLDNMNRS